MDWRQEARCGRMDQALAERIFFGRATKRADNLQGEAERTYAKAICDLCPVREECLREALSVPTRYDTVGVVAGLLPDERKRLRAVYVITPKSGEWIGGPPTDVRRRGARVACRGDG